jgi:hypothetical protein
LDSHGYFKHYRIRSRNLNFTYFRWFGFDVDDDLYELQKLVPVMNSDSQSGFVLTSSGLNSGNLYNLTTKNPDQSATFSTRLNGEFWIKYELPEAQSVDLIDLGACNNESYARDRMPTWFKVEGSNDDENWTTILERAYLTRWDRSETRQYWITSSTAYKFYRLLSIEQPTSTFMLSRFRLYKKIDGRLVNNGFIPPLTSASQAGYEISASSQYNNDHAAFYAFDGNLATRWASTTGVGAWIQVKFPTETLCTSVWLASRNDSSYGQAPSAFNILGSADGINFEILKTVTGQTWNQGEEKGFSFTNTVPYLYYRIEAVTIQNGGSSFALSKLNFGTELREYRRQLEMKEYLVPVMSSNSQDGYVVSAKSNWGSHYPWKAFDRSVSNSDDAWECNDSDRADSSGNCDTWLQIQLPTAKVANALYLQERSGKSTRDQKDFTLQASNDGTTWTTLLAQTDQSYTDKAWEFDNDAAYLYYRLCITKSNQASDNVCVGIMNLLYREIITEY